VTPEAPTHAVPSYDPNRYVEGLTVDGNPVTWGVLAKRIPACSLCGSPAVPFSVGVFLPSPDTQRRIPHAGADQITYRVCPACETLGRDVVAQRIEAIVMDPKRLTQRNP
jgi:hypothetical protein